MYFIINPWKRKAVKEDFEMTSKIHLTTKLRDFRISCVRDACLKLLLLVIAASE